jgi:hypothetical protein
MRWWILDGGGYLRWWILGRIIDGGGYLMVVVS